LLLLAALGYAEFTFWRVAKTAEYQPCLLASGYSSIPRVVLMGNTAAHAVIFALNFQAKQHRAVPRKLQLTEISFLHAIVLGHR